ncbi:UNVERIFIED_CONTAM: Zinc finger protein ZAT9 [Sesamum radiatum]|uniref:Zinc finger protein ZAT9 n=1 Tax=Sesamum radiatum TaxID=300843 RepID=A0AAW2UN59_SESRA
MELQTSTSELQDPDPKPTVAMEAKQCVKDTRPSSILMFPEWLKTGRRTRPGKGSDQDLSDLRSFKSYQALGGHKAHHKDDGFSANVDLSVVRAERKEGSCCGLIHRCPFCHKVFLKGQALGHKRYCGGPKVQKLYSGGGQVATLNESRGFDFDLNQLPT